MFVTSSQGVLRVGHKTNGNFAVYEVKGGGAKDNQEFLEVWWAFIDIVLVYHFKMSIRLDYLGLISW